MPRQRISTPLRWSDMDAYGHVNNVVFLRLLEDARVVAFHGHDSDDGGNVVETGLLVARHEIDYLRPLHYRPEPVAIDLWVTDLGAASFEMNYEVLDDVGPDGTGGPVVYARAESTMVVYDLEAERPRRFTAAERGRLEAWRDAPVPLRRRLKEQARQGTR
ncbi:MAG TPA: thioesterase family protein [Actinomycetales bacterium]|nr:thioesterase family protein [Actinomycetales bacterium]